MRQGCLEWEALRNGYLGAFGLFLYLLLRIWPNNSPKTSFNGYLTGVYYESNAVGWGMRTKARRGGYSRGSIIVVAQPGQWGILRLGVGGGSLRYFVARFNGFLQQLRR
jgi:hypothetical protein